MIKEDRGTQSSGKESASNSGDDTMDTCSSWINIEDKHSAFSDLLELVSISAEVPLTEDFDQLMDMLFASTSPVPISPERVPENSEASHEGDVSRASYMPTQPSNCTTIFISCLTVTVKKRRLRVLFPRCRKITFTKNDWTKNFRLHDRQYRFTSSFSLYSIDLLWLSIKIALMPRET